MSHWTNILLLIFLLVQKYNHISKDSFQKDSIFINIY